MHHAGLCPPFLGTFAMSGCSASDTDQAALIERATHQPLRVVVIDDAGARRWANSTLQLTCQPRALGAGYLVIEIAAALRSGPAPQDDVNH